MELNNFSCNYEASGDKNNNVKQRSDIVVLVVLNKLCLYTEIKRRSRLKDALTRNFIERLVNSLSRQRIFIYSLSDNAVI